MSSLGATCPCGQPAADPYSGSCVACADGAVKAELEGLLEQWKRDGVELDDGRPGKAWRLLRGACTALLLLFPWSAGVVWVATKLGSCE